MGLFDSLGGGLKDALGQVEAAEMPGPISTVLAKTNLGDLQGTVTQLQQGGLGTQVQSWLGSGQNLPVTPDQLRAALGSAHVQHLAQHFGIDPGAALKLLRNIFRPQSIRRARAGRYNRRRNAHRMGARLSQSLSARKFG